MRTPVHYCWCWVQISSLPLALVTLLLAHCVVLHGSYGNAYAIAVNLTMTVSYHV
jgi:hypothetical protein